MSPNNIKIIVCKHSGATIRHGIEGADDAKIIVTAKKDKDDLFICVSDNGAGMPKEEAELVLTNSNRVRKRGSGVGLINVDTRIKILFGEEYGIIFESEPDEGSRVTIHIPAISYTQDNCRKLEGEDERK